jgi:integrase
MKVIRKRNKQSLPHFYLRDKTSKNETPIVLYYKYNNKLERRLTYSSGLVINPKFWDFDKERAKASVLIDHIEINSKLDKIVNHVNNICKSSREIDIVEFRNILDDFVGRQYFIENNQNGIINVAPKFLTWVQYFINSESKKIEASHYTIKKYNSELNKLKDFIKKEYKKDDIPFDSIDLNFSRNYKQFLYKPPYENSQNTVSKSFEVLSTFLKKASKDTYINDEGFKIPVSTNIVFNDEDWVVSRINTSKSILTFEQLIHLYKYDFTNYNTLSRVRYLFLIMAFTALRISDLLTLSKDSIIKNPDGSLFLRVFVKKGRQRKKDTEIIIPVITELKEIFEMYNYNIPNDITEPSMNKYIKEVCKIAGFTEDVQMKSSKGGKPIIENLPLYTTITNHTARYSFITFAINDFGISAEQLAKITGQTLKVLLGYEKGNKKVNAQKVADLIMMQRDKVI